MKNNLSRLLSTFALAAAFTVVPASAVPITGQLAISGTATVEALVLNFLCSGFASGGTCPAGSGDFSVGTGAATTGSFEPYEGRAGFILGINNLAQPLNTPFNLANWITFESDGGFTSDIALDLQFIPLGVSGQGQCAAPEAAGQICTPVIPALVGPNNPLGLSAFNLQNTGNGSSASFGVSGIATRLSTGEQSQFNGIFVAQFSNTPGQFDASYQDVLAELSTGGSVTNTFAASFNSTFTPIPEPGTMTLMGLGGLLVAAGSVYRRRIKN